MIASETLLSLLLSISLGVPLPKSENKSEWVDHNVIIKPNGVPCGTLSEDGEFKPMGYLRSIDYRVLKESGKYLMVHEGEIDVWIARERMLKPDDAIVWYTEYLTKNPQSGDGFAFRGWAWKMRGQPANAIRDYDKAIELSPDTSAWRNNRGVLHSEKGDYDKAIADFDEAHKLSPQDDYSLRNRANARQAKKDYAGAIVDYQAAIAVRPEMSYSYNGLAWLLATCPDAPIRDAKKAIELATKANVQTKYRLSQFLDTLAAAYAEAGDFDNAVKFQEKSINAIDFRREDREKLMKRLDAYREKKPWRDVANERRP